jgi:hypothetical protein
MKYLSLGKEPFRNPKILKAPPATKRPKTTTRKNIKLIVASLPVLLQVGLVWPVNSSFFSGNFSSLKTSIAFSKS